MKNSQFDLKMSIFIQPNYGENLRAQYSLEVNSAKASQFIYQPTN